MGIDDDALNIGRGLLVGVVIDQLRLRSRPVLVVFAALALAGLVAAIVFDDLIRVLGLLAVVVGVIGWVVTVFLRALAGRILRRIAPPAAVADHRDAIQDAVDQLALPTGPISGLRFAWGLRDGIDDELANAADVISTLKERLDV